MIVLITCSIGWTGNSITWWTRLLVGIGFGDEDIETSHINGWCHKLFLLSQLTGFLTTHFCCKIFVFWLNWIKTFSILQYFFCSPLDVCFFLIFLFFFSFLDHGLLLSCQGNGRDSEWGGYGTVCCRYEPASAWKPERIELKQSKWDQTKPKIILNTKFYQDLLRNSLIFILTIWIFFLTIYNSQLHYSDILYSDISKNLCVTQWLALHLFWTTCSVFYFSWPRVLG